MQCKDCIESYAGTIAFGSGAVWSTDFNIIYKHKRLASPWTSHWGESNLDFSKIRIENLPWGSSIYGIIGEVDFWPVLDAMSHVRNISLPRPNAGIIGSFSRFAINFSLVSTS